MALAYRISHHKTFTHIQHTHTHTHIHTHTHAYRSADRTAASCHDSPHRNASPQSAAQASRHASRTTQRCNPLSTQATRTHCTMTGGERTGLCWTYPPSRRRNQPLVKPHTSHPAWAGPSSTLPAKIPRHLMRAYPSETWAKVWMEGTRLEATAYHRGRCATALCRCRL
jgi:hypothetical protein